MCVPFKSQTHILRKNKGLQTHQDLPQLLLLLLVTLADQGEGAGVLPSLVQPRNLARDKAQGGVIQFCVDWRACAPLLWAIKY